MNKSKFTILLIIVFFYSCTLNKNDKIQKHRGKVINVQEQVQELQLDDILLNNRCRILFIKNFLLIVDGKSYDMQLHVFDRNNYNYITSTAPLGQGPGEISNIGQVEVDEKNNRFWITDYGKNSIFCYDLDSVLNNPLYKPKKESSFREAEIPSRYFLIKDSIFMATIIKPTGNYGFNESVAKFNIKTGEISPMKDLHPEIERMRISIVVSAKYNTYAECYEHHDLICIRTLNGDLKYNIYGRHWNTETSNKKTYFSQATFLNDKICTLYSGENTFIIKPDGEPVYNWPTKIMFFDLEGNYLKTIDIGYMIAYYGWDEKKNRLVFSLNDDIQFAYLDLDGII